MNATLQCESCGRLAGPEMIACPERSSDDCPYTLEQGPPSPILGGFLLAGGPPLALLCSGLLIWLVTRPGTLAYLSLLRQGVVPPLDLCGAILPLMALLVGVVSGLATGIACIYCLLGQRVRLYHPVDGAMWQRGSLWGQEVELRVISGLQPLDLNLPAPRPAAYPPSVTALHRDRPVRRTLEGWTDYAAVVFQAALVSLLARGLLELRYSVAHHKSLLRSQASPRREYFVAPGEGADHARVDGLLEQRIMGVATHWAQQPEAKEWPQGATIKALVQAVYQLDRENPGQWLVRMVQRDATMRGYGMMQGTLQRRFEPTSAHAAALQEEGQFLHTLYDRLAGSDADLAVRLRHDVEAGIRSRQRVTAVDSPGA
jgi:hypothetical protein